ncbi:DUF5058 family protein [Lacrimispora sp.]|jgi:hypothetical protein|uniref:DUF5058 family protein n=1 Tax=Lacrimispora sp. TaxID=2719234 RepID=UPI0028A8024E|nr:DUF5058 family protein [Lacrimispora sp.]
MNNYLDIANGGVVFLLCAVVIAYVLAQAVIFMRKAWARGLELGMEKKSIKKVMINSCVVSILPSLPILIILLLLMPSLGRYFPWLRLSVIGSGVYENMAADVTAKAFGLEGIADNRFSLEIFVSAMWVMTIGIIWGPLYTAFGSKLIQKGIKVLKGKQEKRFQAIFASMFIALLCVFSGPYLSTPFRVGTTGAIGLVPLLVVITSMAISWLLDIAAKKSNIKALSEFCFPISLVLGMVSAIIFSQILG